MKMIIESKDNRHFKEFKKLTAVDGVRKYGRVIVSGKKLIKEIAHAPAGSSRSLLIYERYADEDREMQAIVQRFADAGSLYTLKKHLYNELDTFNTNAPLLVIQTPEIHEWDYRLTDGCNILIPFQDPVNVGAVIRSAAGFGVRKIIMLKEAAHPFHPRSIRASAGAVFRFTHPHPAPLPSSQAISATRESDLFSSSPGGRRLRGGGTSENVLCKGPSINELKTICDQRKLNIIALDMVGTPIESFHFPSKFILLPGLEGQGIPEALKASSISIPISGEIESLNAAIATSIILFYWHLNI